MSRSKRKNPIFNFCNVSPGAQQLYRSKENRALRKKVKQLLQVNPEAELPHNKEYGNPWSSPADGKGYYSANVLDKEYHDKLMRK
jgi:hypothetical protein